MSNTVEKVSNEGSRVRFLLFTTIATSNKQRTESNPKMPYHITSQGTLKKSPKNSEIGLCIFNTISSPAHSFSESDQGPSD